MSDREAVPPPPWRNHFFVVIPDTGWTRILLLPGEEGWTLPSARPTGIWLSDVDKVAAALRAELGLNFAFTLLRHLQFELDEAARTDSVVFVVEPATSLAEAPLGGKWCDAIALAVLPLARPEQRALLLDFLAENQGNIPVDPRRPPWAHRGWFAKAEAWLQSTLVDHGLPPTGPVEQKRSWSLSCLLRVPTARGPVYFKTPAALPLFVNEAALVSTLAQLFATQVPTPLATDRERDWMLTEDFGLAIREDPTADHPGLRGPVLTRFAHLQQAAAHHLDALRDAGCIDRRLEVLAAQIDPLLAAPTTRAAISAEDHAALVAFAPALRARIAALAEYNLPATLVHGDLHFGNIAQRNGDFLFFDWTDACISFPFFDMIEVYFFMQDEAERAVPRDAYLAAWTGYESPARLREAWELARPLCALHHAVSYLTLVNHVEPHTRPEIAHGLTDFLGWLLAALREPGG